MPCYIIGVGSNINPYENITAARRLLTDDYQDLRSSTLVQTAPLGDTSQADFVNGAFLFNSSLDRDSLKKHLLNIEKKLQRIRTANKNGPRTIDLDIIMVDEEIVDDDVYSRDFLKDAVIELLPYMESRLNQGRTT